MVFSKQVSNFQIKTCVIPVYGSKSLNLAMAHLLLSPLSAERSPTSQPNVREISVPPTVGQYLFAARLLGHGRRKCDMDRIAELLLEALKCSSKQTLWQTLKQNAYHRWIPEYPHTFKQESEKKWSIQSNFMSTTSIQVAIDSSTPMNRLAQHTLATTLYRNKAAQRRM